MQGNLERRWPYGEAQTRSPARGAGDWMRSAAAGIATNHRIESIRIRGLRAGGEMPRSWISRSVVQGA